MNEKTFITVVFPPEIMKEVRRKVVKKTKVEEIGSLVFVREFVIVYGEKKGMSDAGPMTMNGYPRALHPRIFPEPLNSIMQKNGKFRMTTFQNFEWVGEFVRKI